MGAAILDLGAAIRVLGAAIRSLALSAAVVPIRLLPGSA